jgi:hypothetical protein
MPPNVWCQLHMANAPLPSVKLGRGKTSPSLSGSSCDTHSNDAVLAGLKPAGK